MGATDYLNSNYLNFAYTQEEASAGLATALQLPPIETLPPHIQDFISDISDLEPFEQAMLIHQFTMSNIEFTTQDQTTDTLMSFDQVLAAGVGDCNDIAVFEAGLLQYAGVDPQDIGIYAGVVQYDTGEEAFTILHSFIVLEDEGQFLLLDSNNPESVGVLESGHASVALPHENGGVVMADFQIQEIDQITMPDGQTYMANQPSEASIAANAARVELSGGERTFSVTTSPEFSPS